MTEKVVTFQPRTLPSKEHPRRREMTPESIAWVCQCGACKFWLTPDGAVCEDCNVFAVGWC